MEDRQVDQSLSIKDKEMNRFRRNMHKINEFKP